ncbi:hypothetical protein SARC_10038 [Sphaeroforma arctica JP610]|uniref:Uncharacterized protein n=1 Tax=Sphaeroforma arctica JP610 TaxID=667725 RepID=A0A0L0FNA9_9EUKA|nr:hypothetical protein SARC_10038 [Sphaeroforma arctica JP610]KNC77503.1 hypothetical protein SARC_10038 [Sphaeroforma arctica JP610]|eukprot:XP_014151405.1 hypothetical protein SARC_10038 [Sphaeroforma arctica JP610]
MNGSRLQPEDKEKWLKFWSSTNMQELIGFGQAYNEDSDLHNAFKKKIGTTRAPTSDEYAHNKIVRRFVKALCDTKVDKCVYQQAV